MNAIQPKPTAAAQAVAATAPDGATHKGGMLKKDGTPRRVPVREKGTAISLTMPAALLEAVDKARTAIPALLNARAFEAPISIL